MPRQLFSVVISELAERSCEVRLAELAVEDLQRELAGNHPLHPDSQLLLAGCRARLDHISGSLAELGFHIELPEPDNEDLNRLLEILAAEAKR